MDNNKKAMFKEIIELKLRLLKQDIGSGNCPFAIYPLEIRLNMNCNEVSCRDCTNIWTEYKRKEITKQVYKRYELSESEE